MSYTDILEPQLRIDEGVRYVPYIDSRGNSTIGVGHNQRVPISDAAVNEILMDDIDVADAVARKLFANFDALSDVRQAVVVNMAFNMGETALSGFAQFIGYVVSGQFAEAATDMLGTAWAKEVGERAIRLAQQMRDGS
jgi:lysozyme